MRQSDIDLESCYHGRKGRTFIDGDRGRACNESVEWFAEWSGAASENELTLAWCDKHMHEEHRMNHSVNVRSAAPLNTIDDFWEEFN